MTEQLQIRFDFICRWLTGMLKVVKYVNLTTDSLSCNDVVTLWHVTSFVNLSGMVDLSFNGNSFSLDLVSHSSSIGKIVELSCWLHYLISGIFGGLEWDFNLHYLDIVLLVVAGMCSYQ